MTLDEINRLEVLLHGILGNINEAAGNEYTTTADIISELCRLARIGFVIENLPPESAESKAVRLEWEAEQRSYVKG